MGQSVVQNYIHIVFSVKGRKELIDSHIRPALFAYLAGICAQNNCHVVVVGGHLDHVHILCNLSKNISLKDFLRELKAASSKWMKSQDLKYADFSWQGGYGAFSVGQNELERVKQYIVNQESRHQIKSFEEEYLELLQSNDLDFDIQYLFKD
jgi:REP element-mobilizing transposase RayT